MSVVIDPKIAHDELEPANVANAAFQRGMQWKAFLMDIYR